MLNEYIECLGLSQFHPIEISGFHCKMRQFLDLILLTCLKILSLFLVLDLAYTQLSYEGCPRNLPIPNQQPLDLTTLVVGRGLVPTFDSGGLVCGSPLSKPMKLDSPKIFNYSNRFSSFSDQAVKISSKSSPNPSRSSEFLLLSNEI